MQDTAPIDRARSRWTSPRLSDGAVEALSRRVRKLARRMARPQEADDIAQEALLAVWRNLSSYRGEGPLAHWVDRITERVVFAASRRNQAERDLLFRFESQPAARAGAQEFDHRLAIGNAVRLLDGLPFEQSSAILLHHVYGMSVKEIAGILAVPLETVRSRLRLARAKTRARGWSD